MNFALHLQPCQFGSQSGDLHLMGTHRLAIRAEEIPIPVRYHTAKQGLVRDFQRPAYQSLALA